MLSKMSIDFTKISADNIKNKKNNIKTIKASIMLKILINKENKQSWTYALPILQHVGGQLEIIKPKFTLLISIKETN
jgi:hypothetical protein